MLEKWYDMGDWKLVGAAKKPCPKEQETFKQDLLKKDNFVRTGRNLGIDREKEGSTRSEKSENENMTFLTTPRKVNSALDLFNSFFLNNVKLTKTSTSSPSMTTTRYSTITTTSTKPSTTTTTFSSSGNSNTIIIFPDLESDLVPINSFISDSDDIEIVDYFGDGTGDCCWFNK